ncbi:MAG: GNAT family N-acetyltransferase [Clostridiales bacterium]
MSNPQNENTLNIKKMNKDKIEEVVELISISMNKNEGEWARKTINFHFFSQENKQDDGRQYFIACINGETVGIVGIHTYIWGSPHTTWLGWFAVNPKYQGLKIGYNMMLYIEDYAVKSGFKRLLVETYTTDDFEKARKFYESYGFMKVGGIEDYLDKGQHMVVFGKTL